MTEWPETLNADNWLLRDRLAANRDRVALRLDAGNISYGELDKRSSGVAQALAGSGASPRDRVLVVLPDGVEYAAAVFGVLRIGAVVVAVNPTLAQEALVGILRRARATAALVGSGYRGLFDNAVSAAGVEPPAVLDPSSLGMSDFDTVDTGPEDPAMWIFSGGTTGSPKAVEQTHRSLVNTTRLYGQGSLGLRPDDITISVPKLYFGYALGSNLLFPLSVGASAVLFEEHSTPEALFARIARHCPTVMINVPSAINQMLNHPGGASQDLSSLRFATSAGEALPETLYHRWKETFGVELLDGLGTAEMWHIFVTNTLDDVRPGTLGRVVPGYQIMACDEDGSEVPAGEVGRLWVRGDSLGLGYFEDPERTAEAFRDGWFAGGDLVSIDESGYVTHRGRADDAIKVKGKWFRPQEVESALLDHPSVGEVAVVAVTDEAGLPKPVAFVVPGSPVAEQELIDWVLERLEPYKHPRRVYMVDRLPLTHLGKVDRTALRSMAE